MLNPVGSAGEIVQELIAAPLVLRVDGVTLMPEPTVPVNPEDPAYEMVGRIGVMVSTKEVLEAPAEFVAVIR
jgi:hypothetical protein